MWWGNDFRDLPSLGSPEEVVAAIVEQLSAPIGDVYGRWDRLEPHQRGLP
jgi:hypothetical protein